MKVVNVETIEAPPTRELFTRCFEKRRRPVLMKGLLSDWPAMTKWGIPYFKEKLGDVVVPVRVKPKDARSGYFDGTPEKKLPVKHMRVSDYIELFETGRSTDVYMSGVSIPDFFPNIEEDIRLLQYMNPATSTKKQFWLGIKGTVAPLHVDMWDNFACLVSGRKRWMLFDARDADCLYPHSAFSAAPHVSRLNLEALDSRQFPRATTIVGRAAEMGPGDVLFVPAGWWHQVWTEEDSVLVNYWWFRKRTAFAPWFLRYYPYLALHYTRHQIAQGRIRSGRAVSEKNA